MSYGLDAFSGSSLRLESDLAQANAPRPTSQIVASHPPDTIISASPYCIDLNASPTECVPVAQADITTLFIP